MNFIINIRDSFQTFSHQFYKMALYYPCKCECGCHKAPSPSQISPTRFTNTTRRNYASVSYAPYKIHSNRHVLKIKMVICLDQNVTNVIPKIGSPIWGDLKSRNMIKENIEIPTHSSSIEINEIISNLFPDLNGKRWYLFNSSSCTLKKVPYNVSKNKIFFFNLSQTNLLLKCDF